jgi:hypothetical protein
MEAFAEEEKKCSCGRETVIYACFQKDCPNFETQPEYC